MTEYQGHKDHAHWNVALWLANDEVMYRACLAAIKAHPTKGKAASYLLAHVLSQKTPDRYQYTHERVLAALEGFEE